MIFFGIKYIRFKRKNMSTIVIKNLHVNVGDKEILKGLNLEIKEGETLALLGPNGNGKSTLLHTIMGNPRYKVLEGEILLDGQDILHLATDERSRLGIFLAMQNPSEVTGVNNADFLKAAINAHRTSSIRLGEFYKKLDEAYKTMHIPFEFSSRNLNEGFSGGEKKKNEILQMLLLDPKFTLLDEIDSGLDVDAINIVANVIKCRQDAGKGFLVISHYARLYDLINVDRVAVIIDGKIVAHGGRELIKKIDQEGYEWLEKESGVRIFKETSANDNLSIGVCLTKEIIKNNEKNNNK